MDRVFGRTGIDIDFISTRIQIHILKNKTQQAFKIY